MDDIFNHSGEYPGSALQIGAVFFVIQIYSYLSGYSDIAIGKGGFGNGGEIHSFPEK